MGRRSRKQIEDDMIAKIVVVFLAVGGAVSAIVWFATKVIRSVAARWAERPADVIIVAIALIFLALILLSLKTNIRVFPKPMHDALHRHGKTRSSPRVTNTGTRVPTISDDPPINGHEFEHWVAAKLKADGWDATVTRGSGDQGLDIIAWRYGKSIGIQCKRFKGSVGNGAVQEAHAGRMYHHCNAAAVVTTGRYTRSAKDLSLRTGVILLTPDDLPQLAQIAGFASAYYNWPPRHPAQTSKPTG
ncbi:restriction endonuclease [Pseudogemmobacter humi]|uniref:Restriction endonuclease n=1 Tax=Pseudogemmobacter humi TaxID=2483812 RepID=A0A3P5WN40_9RHOB|nr:restriction endonuclease [Pseudogemmobacter humi]VDC22372.1 Restriction endonuclease [Pseudogemmobacter humi]